ncbi:uncharacterized protein LOC124369473 [Homalodisca vitripennis]|uniref:uncharacterized protein LOC124369473 n=1 Tax=Homalodisca vitripennis TaxID=197043 RepID=UPI001EE9FC57|nr:uncharacterized protein LOC124369473 [Homalodisca vitripennis]
MANKKAWMNYDAFRVWLQSVNKDMNKKKKKILIFIDNCTAHGDIPRLISRGFPDTTQEDNSDQPPTQEIDTAEGWETVKKALELEKDAEFEDFVTFDDDVAV